MSQQINLINPALRQRRDWLHFNVVAPAALLCLALIIVATTYLQRQQAELAQQEAVLGAQLKATQDRLQALSRTLGERKANPALAKEVERLVAAVALRQQALDTLAGQSASERHFSDVMRGLARQRMTGLWLTGFAASADSLEIRGRMLDASLLPDYIRRLDAEAAFQGRRFDMLDMKDVKPPPPAANSTPAARPEVPVLPRHVEFALLAGMADKPPAGGRP